MEKNDLIKIVSDKLLEGPNLYWLPAEGLVDVAKTVFYFQNQKSTKF